jgi:hypothetical protein
MGQFWTGNPFKDWPLDLINGAPCSGTNAMINRNTKTDKIGDSEFCRTILSNNFVEQFGITFNFH